MPTIIQKKLAKALAETMLSSEKKTKAEIVESCGYTGTTLKNPKQVIDTKGVQEELEKLLPDYLITEKHLELLNKKEIVVNKDSGIIYTGQPHSDVKGALDMAYKVKGSYAPTKTENLNLNLSKEITPKEEEIAKKANDDLRLLYGTKE